MTDASPATASTVVVVPDSFKGTLSAAAVAAALAAGVRDAGHAAVELPAGDGGEGTTDGLLAVLGGDRLTAVVADPLGRPVEAAFAMTPDGRAIVESAEACGLHRLGPGELGPSSAWRASTRGAGQLIAAAAAAGATRIVVAVGGSATTDGGRGAIDALRAVGRPLPPIDVLCDVTTPYEAAARVFGPQKGADPATVERLERRLETMARALPCDPRGRPLTGGAGGLAGALWAELGATLVPGAPYVLNALRFDARIARAALVITGEGALDEQTGEGKIVGEVARRCARLGRPCHAVVGRNRLRAPGPERLGLASVVEASTPLDLRAAGKRLAEGLVFAR